MLLLWYDPECGLVVINFVSLLIYAMLQCHLHHQQNNLCQTMLQMALLHPENHLMTQY